MSLFKKKNNSVPDLFCEGNKNYEGEVDIATGFNDSFVNVGPKLANAIQETEITFEDYLKNPARENFVFQNLTPEIVLESVKKLKTKNSAGKDNISTKLLKDIIDCIIYPVTHLFNLSLQSDNIPDEYKCAKIIPIFKSGENLVVQTRG